METIHTLRVTGIGQGTALAFFLNGIRLVHNVPSARVNLAVFNGSASFGGFAPGEDISSIPARVSSHMHRRHFQVGFSPMVQHFAFAGRC